MDPIIYRDPLRTPQFDSTYLNNPSFVGSFEDEDFGPRGVRALPLAAGRNEVGHYFKYFSSCYLLLLLLLATAIQNHRRGCRRVSNFAWAPK